MPPWRWVDGSGDGRRQPPDHPPAEDQNERVRGDAVGHGPHRGQDGGPDDRATNAVSRIGVESPFHLADPLELVRAQRHPVSTNYPVRTTFVARAWPSA